MLYIYRFQIVLKRLKEKKNNNNKFYEMEYITQLLSIPYMAMMKDVFFYYFLFAKFIF